MYKSIKEITMVALVGVLGLSSAVHSSKAEAMIQMYKCHKVKVSVDGGAVWGEHDVCVADGVRPGGDWQQKTETVYFSDIGYQIDGIPVSRLQAVASCMRAVESLKKTCDDAVTEVTAEGTLACGVAAYVNPLIGAACGTVAFLTVHDMTQFCAKEVEQATNKCTSL